MVNHFNIIPHFIIHYCGAVKLGTHKDWLYSENVCVLCVILFLGRAKFHLNVIFFKPRRPKKQQYHSKTKYTPIPSKKYVCNCGAGTSPNATAFYGEYSMCVCVLNI